jgi:hypothetical protein
MPLAPAAEPVAWYDALGAGGMSISASAVRAARLADVAAEADDDELPTNGSGAAAACKGSDRPRCIPPGPAAVGAWYGAAKKFEGTGGSSACSPSGEYM